MIVYEHTTSFVSFNLTYNSSRSISMMARSDEGLKMGYVPLLDTADRAITPLNPIYAFRMVYLVQIYACRSKLVLVFITGFKINFARCAVFRISVLEG